VVTINFASSKNSCIFNVAFYSVIYNYVVYYWLGPSCLPRKFVYVFVSVKWVCYSISLKFIFNIIPVLIPNYEFIICIFTQKKFLTKKLLPFIILLTFYCHWYKTHTIQNHETTVVISVQGYAYCSWCSAIIGNYMRIKLQAAHHWYNKIQATLRQDTFTLHLQENHPMSSLSTEIVMKTTKNVISNCSNW